MTLISAKKGARPHVVIIHRWRDGYADYARYLDHKSYAVSYVSTDVGMSSVPENAASVSIVSHTDDLAEVGLAVSALVPVFGVPAGIIALKEDDLLIAARLREEWACLGPRYEDLVLFRDKYLTCRAATRAGIAVPAYAPVSDAGELRAFARAHGWPVVVKPRSSSASEGIVVLRGPADIRSIGFADGRPRMVQVFDHRPIYHVDGIYAGGSLAPWRASRYISNCLDFRGGSLLGSVEEDDPAVLAAIGPFAERLLAALTSEPAVFHLELFMAGADCALLEVGARVGGAEIAFLWREVHGIDLMHAAFDIQLGRAPHLADTTSRTASRTSVPVTSTGSAEAASNPDRVAGWLLVPAPDDRPCRITEVTSMTGRPLGPYAEAVPSLGDVLPAADSYYEHVGGRFRFRGTTTKEVESALMETARSFRVRGEPVDFVATEAGP